MNFANLQVRPHGWAILRSPEGDPPPAPPPPPPPKEDPPIDPQAHAALASAHDRLKRDAAADREQLRKLQETVDKAEKEREERERAEHEKAGNFDAIRKQLEENHAKELAKRDEKITTLENDLRTVLIDRDVGEALDKARVKPELKRAAMAMLTTAGIEVKKGDDGKMTVLKDGVPVAENIKIWASTDEGKAFVLDGNSGGDAPGGDKGGTANNPWKRGPTWSLTEQSRLEVKDPEKAKQLKAEAGVA